MLNGSGGAGQVERGHLENPGPTPIPKKQVSSKYSLQFSSSFVGPSMSPELPSMEGGAVLSGQLYMSSVKLPEAHGGGGCQ